jgi:hypothetical protein
MYAGGCYSHPEARRIIDADFASIYLNRGWYFLLLVYINHLMDNFEEHVTPKEIFEMQRVWILQCLYGTTASNFIQRRI